MQNAQLSEPLHLRRTTEPRTYRSVEGDSVVYVVDGEPRVRRALARLAGEAGAEVRTFESAEAFLHVAAVLTPGCVLAAMTVPSIGGLGLQAELRAKRIDLPLIALGDGRGDLGLAVRVMKAGAFDYIERPFDDHELLQALEAAQAELRGTLERRSGAALATARIAGMSAREREVLQGLLAGGTNKTIGRSLGISPRTVEIHRGRLMERLGARSLPQAVVMAIAAGLRPEPASQHA